MSLTGREEGSAERIELQLSVAVVARQIGVAPATLRTWARRYGLGPSTHAPGAHRRYGPADVARLRAMRRLTVEGMSPADAARVVLAERSSPIVAGPDRLPDPRADWRAIAPRVDVEARRTVALPAWVAHRGGGRVLALPGGSVASRGLATAAMALDAASVHRVLRRSVAEVGVVATWDEVIRPVLVAVGERWHATGETIEVEHLLSAAVIAVFGDIAGSASDPLHGRPVLLAAAPEESHGLPLSALAAALGERGTGTRMLGTVMPPSALAAAVRRTGPAAVVVLALSAQTADARVLHAVPTTRPPLTLLAAGPGWPGRVSAGAAVVRDLAAAVRAVEVAVGVAPATY